MNCMMDQTNDGKMVLYADGQKIGKIVDFHFDPADFHDTGDHIAGIYPGEITATFQLGFWSRIKTKYNLWRFFRIIRRKR